MQVLILSDYVTSLGGVEAAINLIQEKSRHNVTIALSEKLATIDLDKYDVIHLNNVWNANPFLHRLENHNVVLTLHDFRLLCNKGLYVCVALKTNCVTCRGILPYIYSHLKRMVPLQKYVEKYKPSLIVHSKFMEETYSFLSPTYLPLPLEVDEMNPIPLNERKGYLFFSGRCAYEKNPIDFARLCLKLKQQGVMALHNLSLGGYYVEYMRELQKYPVEVYVTPSKKELFELYSHAKLAVFPNLFPEPFGIAQANALLFQVPIIAYPLGNLNYTATVKAWDFNDLVLKVHKLLVDKDHYLIAYAKVKMQRKVMANTHGASAVIKLDMFYEESAKC